MVWQQWVYLAWAIIGVMLVVGHIGKPRTPIKPAEAVIQLVLMGLLVWLVLSI